MAFSNFEPSSRHSPWRENHGNLLTAFVIVILIAGSCVMAYRRYRFVPARFPPERMIRRSGSDQTSVLAEPDPAGEPTLTIRVSGAVSDDGLILVAIYDSPEAFNDPDRAFGVSGIEINEGVGQTQVSLLELPPQIAIAAFHDENEDGMLNRNSLGIPTERYGFSNNVRGIVGPPRFDEAAIEGPYDSGQIEISIR